MDSSRQKQHYTQIHDAFEAHYYDSTSMEYRERFIYRWLFDGVDFRNGKVADLACGSDYNSLALKERCEGVTPVGFAISEPACASYRRVTGNEARVADLTKPADISETFDGALV